MAINPTDAHFVASAVALRGVAVVDRPPVSRAGLLVSGGRPEW